jgi:phage-related protein
VSEPPKAYEAEFYVTLSGDCPVDEYLDDLVLKHRAKVEKWIEKLEEQGPNLPRPYADVLEGPIRELRIQFGHMKYRILYFIHKRIVLLTHGIVKKTGPVPPGEIDRAKRCMYDWLSRPGNQ